MNMDLTHQKHVFFPVLPKSTKKTMEIVSPAHFTAPANINFLCIDKEK